MKQPGDRIDRYLVERLLGRGGMGEVYEATDTRLGRRVALKLLPADADADALQRMLREARAAAALEHPNAVVVFDVGEADGSGYIAMELVRGHSLRAHVGDPTIPLPRRLRWLVEIASAVGAAHAAGLVHRDIKPDNVMIRDDGAAKVLDFGIARRRAAPVDPSAPTESGGLGTITNEGVVVGTPLYSAPEQLRSEELDGRADQFAWGVTAYELLTGAPPWRGSDSIALLSRILSADPPPIRPQAPEVPDEVERAVLRALAKRPADRFPSIEDASAALEPFAETPAPTGPRRERSSRTGPATDGDAASTAASRAAAHGPVRRVARGLGRATLWLLTGLGALLVGIIAFGLVLKAVTGKSNITIGGDPALVNGIACQPARLQGLPPAAGKAPAPVPPADPSGRFDLARAIGVGACARLATEVGVEWNVADGADALSVTAGIGAGAAEVTLEIGGKTGHGKGATPIDAVVAAVGALAKQLRAPPPDEERVRAWGARDAESARRIERLWRRMVLALTPSYEQEVGALVESDGDSPWPHVFAALIGLPGAESSTASRQRARELLDKLPPARKALLSGLFLLQDKPAERVEALRLMRKAYGEAPDDPDVAGIYAAVIIGLGATEEGFAVVDRIVTRHPTRSMLPINNALSGAAQPDIARDRRLLDRLWATLPETAAWGNSVKHLVLAGNNAEARAALEFGKQLGMGSESTFRVGHEYAAALLELAELRPAEARERASALLGDPSLSSAISGTRLVMASYYLEGRVTDAEAAAGREMERQKSNGSPPVAARLALKLARIGRWLGRPAPPEEQLKLIEATLADRPDRDPQRAIFVRCEVALLRLGADPKGNKLAAERTLADAEASAEKEAHGDRMFRDAGLLGTLALLRAVRGDAAAARRWQETDRAPSAERRTVAYDAGLALEAAGQTADAEKAYLVAHEPAGLDDLAFERMAAEIRLARLDRAQGRLEDAARRDALLQRLWAAADPGVREALERAR